MRVWMCWIHCEILLAVVIEIHCVPIIIDFFHYIAHHEARDILILRWVV